MNLNTKPSKFFFEQEIGARIEQMTAGGVPVRLLELGSGTSEIADRLLERFPSLSYVGIEPDAGTSAKAASLLARHGGRGLVIKSLAYGGVREKALEEKFDICFSLSVLEHVKTLEPFLQFSSEMTKLGGEIAHLYDLGHSLYPHNLKERLQVMICDSFLRPLVPEGKIAGYVDPKEVKRLLEKYSCDVKRTTYHNMRSHVAMLKGISNQEKKLAAMRDVIQFEQAHMNDVEDQKLRERLFPSICLWATKR